MSTGNISLAVLKYFDHKRIKALLDEALHDLLIAMPEDPLAFLEATFQKKTPLRLMIAGIPGSGKGCQCQLLAEKYGIVHISAGDMLREVTHSDSQVAKEISQHIMNGTLVPDNLFVSMVIREVKKAEAQNIGWILDGFPRTRAQAIYLQTSGISPQKFFFIDLPEEIAAPRTIARTDTGILSGEGSITSERPPSVASSRMDDTPDTVATRLQYFLARKEELLDCYSPFYVRIDGDQTINAVHADICEVVDALDLPE